MENSPTVVGRVMSTAKPRELARSNKSAEMGEVIWNVEHQSGTVDQSEDTGKQASTLIRQVSLVSTREIDRLIGDLKQLRDRLKNDGDRIQGDIVEYASLSQSAVQLTKIVTDSMTQVKGMSDPPSVNTKVADPIIPGERTPTD
jgi:hypothetical protein